MNKKIIWNKYISPETKFYARFKTKKELFLNGPNGIVFPDDAADKKFNIYEGDCNFIVTVKDFNKIAKVSGVEMAYPVTPYKVRVGIAKMFSDKEVLKNIDNAVNPFDGIHDEIISKYLDQAKQSYKNYMLYEDFSGMIKIAEESQEQEIDGFIIFRKNPKPSGV